MRHERNGSEVHDRVLAVLQENAASLLKIARRHSLCDDDANDAYQRGLEIYLQRLDKVDPLSAGPWLRTVVKHEAMSIRELRQRTLGTEEIDFDEVTAARAPSSEDRMLAFDRVARAAEALQSCKRDEVAAMVLKADGHSYDEICSVTGWSYTKVNRCLSEGRSRFLERYAAIESGEECERLAPLLSMIVDGEASPIQMAEARPHLRNCSACRASLRAMAEGSAAIHVLFPATILAGGVGLPDGAASFWSFLVSGVHDRIALTALKAQQAVETVSATKAAAVAASAAAVAGGGAVAVERTLVEPERAKAEQRIVPVKKRQPVRKKVVVARATATPAPAPVRKRRPRASRAAVAAPAPTAPPRREFAFEASASPAPEPAAKKAKAESFGFER